MIRRVKETRGTSASGTSARTDRSWIISGEVKLSARQKVCQEGTVGADEAGVPATTNLDRTYTMTMYLSVSRCLISAIRYLLVRGHGPAVLDRPEEAAGCTVRVLQARALPCCCSPDTKPMK